MTRTCPPPDPRLREPRLVVPPGAVDTHLHIFGPKDRYPFVSERRFTPPDASVASYPALRSALGLTRAVLVQPHVRHRQPPPTRRGARDEHPDAGPS